MQNIPLICIKDVHRYNIQLVEQNVWRHFCFHNFFFLFFKIFQYPKITGQSQNMCMVSNFPRCPQNRAAEGSLGSFEITSGVWKYLMFNFQSNFFHCWLLIPFWLPLHNLSHSSSTLMVFDSNSHFSFILHVFWRVCDESLS